MEKKIKAEFIITDLSKGLSISDVQKAALSLFSSPMVLPKDSPKIMTLEEFIKEAKDEG